MKAKIIMNEEKCAACGMCVQECPEKAIRLSKKTKTAVLVNKNNCISCGHCAAICPRDAIKISAAEGIEPIHIRKIEDSLNAEQRIFHEKRSVRNFTDKVIDAEEIKRLISYAEKAPSSHNMRKRNYIVIQDEKKIQEMTAVIIHAYEKVLHMLNPFVMGMIRIFDRRGYEELSKMKLSFRRLVKEYKSGENPIFFHSKCIVCISAPKNSVFSRDDCICAEQYLMLYAKTNGIDSYIVGYAQWAHKHLEKYLKVEKGNAILAVAALGYGKYQYKKEVVYEEPKVQIL